MFFPARARTGCPECAKEKRIETRKKNLVEKHGSFADHYPELVEEWHPTNNGALTPFDFTSGSGEKVWWICIHGHEWEATIASRAGGRGCQLCYREKQGQILTNAIIKKRGSLADRFPEIAKDLHPTRNGKLSAFSLAPRSGKKVWWQCEKGHEWEQTVHDRTRPSPCPECYKQSRARGSV